MDIKNVKGMAVLSIDDGERLGSVTDILFNLDDRRVEAFVIGGGGIFGGSAKILEMRDVQSIGTDAIMIASRDLINTERSDSRYKSFPDLGAVTSLRVVSQDGSLIGNLAGVQIDPASGRLTDIEVSHGGLIAQFRANIVVPAGSVVSFGRDVAVIPEEIINRPTDQAPPDQGPPTSPSSR